MKLRAIVGLLALAATALAQPMAPDSELPAGHPPIGQPSGPAGAAEQGGQDTRIPDATMPAKDLAVGSIEARIVNEREEPLVGVDVRLGILRQTVAEGEERTHREAKTDKDGVVRFSGLETGSDHSYRVTVRKDPAEYASDPFSLTREAGQRVLLHVYPVTTDVSRALVGMRGIVVVEPRDDVFQFQIMFRIFNMGRVTWVPNDVTITLPEGAKGFNAQESMSDARFVSEGDRARLLGTYAPGEQEASFTFQVPNEFRSDVEFELSLPPHVAELRVIAEAARGMSLEVPGFQDAESSTTASGSRVLVTGRRLRAGEPEMRSLRIQLSGVPVPGPGRWIAAAIAALTAVLGFGLALSRAAQSRRSDPNPDADRAREVLLTELVALEKAHRAGDVGPRTYESTRRVLLDALARLDSENPPAAKRQKPTGLSAVTER